MTIDEQIAVMQAFRDGNEVEYKPFESSQDWKNCRIDGGPIWDFSHSEYRIKPEPKLVPLEVKDVPPGSVIRFNQSTEWDADLPEEWTGIGMVSKRRGLGTITGDGRVVFVSWEEAMNHTIKRPGEDWKPCHKPA